MPGKHLPFHDGSHSKNKVARRVVTYIFLFAAYICKVCYLHLSGSLPTDANMPVWLVTNTFLVRYLHGSFFGRL
eukprot:767608-Amphidinium_carterae.1